MIVGVILSIILFGGILALFGLFLYYVIKRAVKDAIYEARNEEK